MLYEVITTGSKTLIRIVHGDKFQYWEPFNLQHDYRYQVERHLYKNALGNKLMFEEINHDLGLIFSYQWATSDQHGFIRQATLKRRNNLNALVKTQPALKIA